MAAISMKIVFDEKAIAKKLNDLGENGAKALNRTRTFMARRAPVQIARTAAATYNIAQA